MAGLPEAGLVRELPIAETRGHRAGQLQRELGPERAATLSSRPSQAKEEDAPVGIPVQSL